jgi:predicted nucleotide-binding protein (sugar kinase/HSP70/actin superfamily)
MNPVFTQEMKKDYTILVPTMLPMHFKIMERILRSYGYNAVLLDNSGPAIKEQGLKYVHNDTCYPALLVIGQLLDALTSGKYDPNRVALLISQTGGGCRASNYIALLRKALKKAGLEQVPVLSLNISGLESQPGFKLTMPLLQRLLYAVLYGDLLMLLRNQCRPYEVNEGEAQALADKWVRRLTAEMARKRVSYGKIKENYRAILKDFAKIPLRHENRIRVGVVGEIFVKFSPLGNNELEEFLYHEGAEVVMPGLYDFCLYCVYNNVMDGKLYGLRRWRAAGAKLIFEWLVAKQKDMISIIKEHGVFRGPTPFGHTISLTRGYIGIGAKMGEGWLLTAEMLELIDQGVENIICTQPFGCLPNHIVGKGMMKPIKERHPGVNIVAVDYDPGATKINQENRIKLMLANANQMQTV